MLMKSRNLIKKLNVRDIINFTFRLSKFHQILKYQNYQQKLMLKINWIQVFNQEFSFDTISDKLK